MSWVDQIEEYLVITTGDGEVYSVIWVNAKQSTDYNVSEYNFPNIPGTLVKKFKPLGRKFPLEFYFQGTAHLDQAELFRVSANDERPCVMRHPYYGTITFQLTALEMDDTAANVTRFTCMALETLTEDSPKTTVEPIDLIPVKFENLNAELEISLTEVPNTPDIIRMNDVNSKTHKSGLKIITEAAEADEFTNAFNIANTYINTATATPLLAMRSAINVITLPAKFTAGVIQRMGVLVQTFDLLRATLFGLISVSAKQIYQNQQGSNIAAMCQAAATPLAGNYRTAGAVTEIMDIIQSSYRTFLADLDDLQGANGGSPLNFIAAYQAMTELSELVSLTLSNLYDIALSGKRERIFICDKETNLISLTHRFYGMDANDNNLNDLMENNNIGGLGIEELIQIRKGRKIIYYI